MIDFQRIGEESREIGLTVYDGITAGKDAELPDEYIQKFTPILRERVCLAAFRLAYMIHTIFGSQ
jgi:hypothetical protein